MKRNTVRESEALGNFLRNCFTTNENFLIHPVSDGRAKKYAIAKRADMGGIIPLTKFMSYDEMNCFFMGMLTVKENRIDFYN